MRPGPLPLMAVALLGVATLQTQRAVATSHARVHTILPIEYRISVAADGSPWGEWMVTQGANVTEARWLDENGVGDVALVGGSAVGGLPAEPRDDHGGLLGVVFDRAPHIEPGAWKSSSYGSGTAIVDSLKLDLREGAAHERISGHDARHHVLTARLWWRHVGEKGVATPVEESGTADLWLATDLPFSWLPFAVHPARPGQALPLANSWPEVGWRVIAEYGTRLEQLGLLLRARVRDEVEPAENPAAEVALAGGQSERVVVVSDVKPAPSSPDVTPYAELPRLGQSRAAMLQALGFVLEPCASLQSAAGTFEFSTSGSRSYMGNGAGAVFTTEGGVDSAYVIVTGSVQPQRAECTLLMLPGETPRTGGFPIAAPSSFAQPAVTAAHHDETVVAVHVYVENGALHRVLVLEGGEVQISAASDASVAGKLIGRGWLLELDPRHRRQLHEDITMNLTFNAGRAGSPTDLVPADQP